MLGRGCINRPPSAAAAGRYEHRKVRIQVAQHTETGRKGLIPMHRSRFVYSVSTPASASYQNKLS